MTSTDTFLFVCCQAGAELPCKQELLARYPGLRIAYSRPGFLTFKCDDSVQPGSWQLVSTFARVWGWSLGKISGSDSAEMTSQVAARFLQGDFQAIHCWERDSSTPGHNGFEPGVTPLAETIGGIIHDRIRKANPDKTAKLALNRRTRTGDSTFVVCLVEPGEWWMGWHASETVTQTWPAGVPILNPPDDMINRAWLKIAEAVLWGKVPIREGDLCAEIGSAPGGASQYLLGLGARVIAIDPAEMDPRVASHPSLTHLRRRARDVRRKELAEVRWLIIDVNMPPSYTIEVISDFATSRHIHLRGIIATMKLSDWSLATKIESLREQVRRLGFPEIRTRQLAFNRREFCLVALKSRFQRRLAGSNPRLSEPTAEDSEE